MRDAAGIARPVLAYDIGGSKTLAALVEGGTVLAERRLATDRQVGSDGWFAALAGMAEDWRGRFDTAGVAVTGVVDAHGWSGFNLAILEIPPETPLAARLAEGLGVPVRAWNDAQAAAWGEYRHGAGEGRDMVFVTVSSGIGGGVVLDGRLMVGRHGIGGSLGQTGSARGTRLEDAASGFGIAARAAALGRELSAQQVFAAADAGEAWAAPLIAEAAALLAAALADVQALIDPEVMVVGGGVGLNPRYQAALTVACETIEGRLRPAIVPARLGIFAGVVGAADLAAGLRTDDEEAPSP